MSPIPCHTPTGPERKPSSQVGDLVSNERGCGSGFYRSYDFCAHRDGLLCR